MAVYAAHLTRTLQGTPSIFQITAQEALGSTVKPALRKLVEYLAAVYPHKFGWCLRWYDEVYLLFDCCLQYHYLKRYAASFSESFYGLIRVPMSYTSDFNSGQRLPEALERGSLALLVLIPYLKDKIDSIVEKWREDEEDGKLGKSYIDRLRVASIRLHAISHLVTSSACVYMLCRYLSSGTGPHSPSLWALGLVLKDAPPRAEEHSWGDVFKGLWNGKFGSAVATLPALGSVVLSCAEYGAFAVQFIRWWEARAQLSTAALPPPPPPQRDEKASKWTNKCPICLQSWKIPTVLPVSGYIFCYTCISKHVRARGTCPITNYPTTEQSLIRLYVD